MALLLTLVAGQCFLDQGDQHWMHGGMMLDLCLLMMVVLSVPPAPIARPLVSGWAAPYLTLDVATAPVRALDPPPKIASRA